MDTSLWRFLLRVLWRDESANERRVNWGHTIVRGQEVSDHCFHDRQGWRVLAIQWRYQQKPHVVKREVSPCSARRFLLIIHAALTISFKCVFAVLAPFDHRVRVPVLQLAKCITAINLIIEVVSVESGQRRVSRPQGSPYSWITTRPPSGL